MKKTILALTLSTLLASAALAMGPFPLLKYESTNGVRMPMYQNRTTCLVYGNKVTIQNLAGDVMPLPKEVKIAFTADVKNLDEMEALIEKAKDGQVLVAKCLPPPGAGKTSFSMIQLEPNDSTRELPLLIKFGNQCGTINTSPEAKKLVEFIKYNCTEQN